MTHIFVIATILFKILQKKSSSICWTSESNHLVQEMFLQNIV